MFKWFSKEAREERKVKREQAYSEAIEKVLNGSELEKMQGFSHIVRKAPISTAFNVDYIGGHYANPKFRENARIILLPQGILFQNFKSDVVVLYDDIKNMTLESEMTIESNATLTRMVCFGVYALAMKKKKKAFSQFIVLDCEKNGMKYSMVLGGKQAPMVYSEIFKRRL